MSARRGTPWARIDFGTGLLWCDRCGDRYQLTLPASLNIVAAVCKAYGQEHRGCPKPKAKR